MNESKILVVDDEQGVLTVLDKALTSEGYSVITADNGSDAIKLAESEQPGLIILDVLMPEMDGGEVARRLKESPSTSHIPVIFLTCLLSREEEARIEDHEIGGHVFIAKPYDITGLLAHIEKLLGTQYVEA